MWTLKKLFKDILGDYNSLSFNEMSSMQIFDFSTLYNIILHANLKTRSKEIITTHYTLKMVRNVIRLSF